MIVLNNVSKIFTLHNQGSAVIPVFDGVNLRVDPGECVSLTEASGAGKSTLMQLIYWNYLAASGSVVVGDVDVVAEPLLVLGVPRDAAMDRAMTFLARLNISKRLWYFSPTTFSRGEQQRVNIARGFTHA